MHAVSAEEKGYRTHVLAAAEHETQPIAVVRPDAIERPAGFRIVLIEIRRAISVIRRLRVEGVRDQEIDAAELLPVQQPFHLRIRHVLAVGAEDFAEGDVVRLAAGV